MKALIYVEGPSDRAALEVLLRPVIEQAKTRGCSVRFLPKGGKSRLLAEVPSLAADHLSDNPDDLVVALPDLYPTTGFDRRLAHDDYEGLCTVLKRRFLERAKQRRIPPAAMGRFRVHCLQHDLESLLLSSVESLRWRLGTKDRLQDGWTQPVERQNHDRPPKRVVEQLFVKYNKTRYRDSIDAPVILARTSLDTVLDRCQIRFQPFVDELRAFAAERPVVSRNPP